MIRVFHPIPVEQIKLLVFDLDGTLIDSAQDLCNSVNATLAHFGLKHREDTEIASFIGDGALMLVRRALANEHGTPVAEDFLQTAHAFFLDYYRAHKLDFTYAYDGVLEALAALKDLHNQPRAMAVLTNKPVRPARDICAALGLAPYFLEIYGGNSFPTKKPAPEGLRALMAQAGAAPVETFSSATARWTCRPPATPAHGPSAAPSAWLRRPLRPTSRMSWSTPRATGRQP
jgi:phosphoglycolate phosphatase